MLCVSCRRAPWKEPEAEHSQEGATVRVAAGTSHGLPWNMARTYLLRKMVEEVFDVLYSKILPHSIWGSPGGWEPPAPPSPAEEAPGLAIAGRGQNPKAWGPFTPSSPLILHPQA